MGKCLLDLDAKQPASRQAAGGRVEGSKNVQAFPSFIATSTALSATRCNTMIPNAIGSHSTQRQYEVVEPTAPYSCTRALVDSYLKHIYLYISGFLPFVLLCRCISLA